MRRARELSDHLEIVDLLHRYARAIDSRDFELLETVFTPDAVIHYDVDRGAKLQFGEMVGWLRTALQIFAATQHVIANPLIELDGDAARSTCSLTATHVQITLDGEESVIVEGGIYRDLHVRSSAGWRIRERTLNRVYVNGEYLPPERVRLFARPRGV